MSSLRLGTHALLPTDVELVRMLLRLYGIQGKCQWAYAEAPPYDAVLVEASALEASPLPDTEPAARHVLRLTRADTADTTDTLPRPLCADRLRRWLDRVENTLASSSPAAPESAPVPATSSVHVHPPAQEAAASESMVLPPEDAPRFRLQRWPRQGILRDDPGRIRMATLLSRRALNAHDLVSLTGFTPHQCQVFMQILHASSLLQAAVPVTQDAAGPAVSLQPPSPAKPRFTQGLIAGLRKRLGL